MAEELQLEVVTPQRTILNESVEKVILPGIQGEMGILPEHVPLLTIMDSGILSYTLGNDTISIAIHEGYAQVDGKSVRVLVELAEKPEEIDLDRAKQAELNAKKQLHPSSKSEATKDDENIQKYEHKLKRSLTRQRLVQLIG
tara:strand:- start:337 stop:762 length:426 start_codon:yes stop_codon:yes gene_type:complete